MIEIHAQLLERRIRKVWIRRRFQLWKTRYKTGLKLDNLRSRVFNRMKSMYQAKSFTTWVQYCSKVKTARNSQLRAARIVQRADRRVLHRAYVTWLQRIHTEKRSRFLVRRAMAKLRHRRKKACFDTLILTARCGVERRRGTQQIFRLFVRLAKRKTAYSFLAWRFWRPTKHTLDNRNRLISRLVGKSNENLLFRYFRRWQDKSQKQRATIRAIRKVALRLQWQEQSFAMAAWIHFISTEREKEKAALACAMRLMNRKVFTCLAVWKDRVRRSKSQRVLLARFHTRMQKRWTIKSET